MKNLTTNTTIELVGYGHPDRFADYIGEVILTECLKQDENSKVAIEVLATKNSISLGGEITSKAIIDFEKLIYLAIEKIYGVEWWPNYKKVDIFNHIEEQSLELNINQLKNIVAADQGVIYGYYDKERFNIISNLYELMNNIKNKFNIAPDWKLLFNTEKKILSMSVCGKVNHKLINNFIQKEMEKDFGKLSIIVNPKGEWLIPGPSSDSGVIGRKLMIDTFGAGIPHGGGAFCGKDPSKVDKTGIIIASYLAKEAAINNRVSKALVELNYKIGDELPNAYVYFEDGQKVDITNDISLTLDQYIRTYGLLKEDWSEFVIKGGVISYLQRK